MQKKLLIPALTLSLIFALVLTGIQTHRLEQTQSHLKNSQIKAERLKAEAETSREHAQKQSELAKNHLEKVMEQIKKCE